MNEIPSQQGFIDNLVEAFEVSVATSGDLNITEFVPNSSHPYYIAATCELIRVEIEYRSRSGEFPVLDEYRRRFPEVLAHDDSCTLIDQEVQRNSRRALTVKGAIVDPSSPDQESQELSFTYSNPQERPTVGHQENEANSTWPEVGASFLDFELVEELGRGSFARVFLAKQGTLARRQVVVKVVKGVDSEPQWLAKMQHQNIVPVYSVHNVDSFQALCMPYFGRNTLVQHLPPVEKGKSSSSEPSQDGNQQPLAATNENSMTELALLIAKGLRHAHRRGIIHGDLKPANILIADDGTPMLLDFNLASRIQPDKLSERVGGTIPYMAPEQLDAVRSLGTIDARADIYSFGVILYQLLIGTLPFPERRGSLKLVIEQSIKDRQHVLIDWKRAKHGFSPDLASIVNRCLAEDREQRYSSSDELVVDLQAHRDSFPLRYAANNSWLERFAKWRRRHPWLGSIASLVVVCTALLVVTVLLARYGVEASRRAHAINIYADFEDQYASVRSRLSVEPGSIEKPQATLEDVERVIQPFDVEQSGWHERWPLKSLSEVQKNSATRQIAELLFLSSEMLIHSQTWQGMSEHERLSKAKLLNQSAMAAFDEAHIPSAFVQQRIELIEALDSDEPAERWRSILADNRLPPDSETRAYERYLDGVASYLNNDRALAIHALNESIELAPLDFSTWLMLGNCQFASRDFGEAEASYNRCLTLAPDSVIARFYLGLTHFENEQLEKSEKEFLSVLDRRPEMSVAKLNLAIVQYRLSKPKLALDQLTQLEASEGLSVRGLVLRSRVHQSLDQHELASRDLELALSVEARDADDMVSRGVLLLETSPEQAATAFREALRLEPDSYAARLNLAHTQTQYLSELAEGIRTLDHLVELYPDDSHARVVRGVIHARRLDLTAALRDGQAALDLEESPDVHYQVACILSLLEGVEGNSFNALAVDHLRRAMLEQEYALFAAQDGDLANLRQSESGQQVIESALVLWNPVSDE